MTRAELEAAIRQLGDHQDDEELTDIAEDFPVVDELYHDAMSALAVLERIRDDGVIS